MNRNSGNPRLRTASKSDRVDARRLMDERLAEAMYVAYECAQLDEASVATNIACTLTCLVAATKHQKLELAAEALHRCANAIEVSMGYGVGGLLTVALDADQEPDA